MKFPTILIDPPWRFRVYSRDTGTGRSAESHYRTMPLEELMGLDIQGVAEKDCALLMWSTPPMLPESILLGQAWGFKYKTIAFTWAKVNRRGFGFHMGMGYWTRANAEFCILFTRGAPKRLRADVRQLIVAPLRQHSQKPDEQYERIERLLTGPYLEIFARTFRPGWHSLGNEIDGQDIRDALLMMKYKEADNEHSS